MADIDPTKDGITRASPTTNPTPVQAQVEKAVNLDSPAARTSIPLSAKNAAAQSSQPIEEFTGNVKRGGIFTNTPGQTGYRPVGPKVQAAEAPIPESSFTEKMAQGAKYAPPKVEPSIAERMAQSAKYVPPKVDPYTGEAIREGESLGAKLSSAANTATEAAKGAVGKFKTAARGVLASPLLTAAGAYSQNKQALESNVARPEFRDTGATGTAIRTEAALQAMRDPMLAYKALATAMGAKEPAAETSVSKINESGFKPTEVKPRQIAATYPGAETAKSATAEATKTAISTEPKAPSYTPEQIEEFSKGGTEQAVSKGKGSFRYVQGPNGEIIKQDTSTGKAVPMYQGVTGNVLAPGEESPMAKMVRDSRAAKAAAREAAFREALIRQAFQPIDGSTNIADVGTIKRNRLMAQQLLDQMDRGKQADAALGLEEKKLASTERATAATQEQNRLSKEADQRIRDRQAAATERQADIAAKAEERKASEKTYMVDGKAVKMTDERYRQYQNEKARDKFLKGKVKNEGLSPEEAEAEYATVAAAQSQVSKALADPKNADKRDAIIAAYRKATGLDYIE